MSGPTKLQAFVVVPVTLAVALLYLATAHWGFAAWWLCIAAVNVATARTMARTDATKRRTKALLSVWGEQ